MRTSGLALGRAAAVDSTAPDDMHENGEAKDGGGLAHMAPEDRLQVERKAFRDVNERLKEEKRLLEAENEALREKMEEKSGSDTSDTSDTLSGLEGASPLPNVYGDLPPLLQKASSTFEQRHEKDVFLTSALPALGSAMPNVRGYYGNVPEPLSPHLYSAIVASAASGKGPAKWGRKLVERVDEHIREKAQEMIEAWKERKKEHENDETTEEPFDEPKPPEKALFLPANTSAAAFHEGLLDFNEQAFVCETEIDTMVNALGQEWGKWGDALRKAFHHEPVSYRRKGEGSVELESPRLSVVLSGTPRQFSDLMGSSESGLYSRFALYYFEAPLVWVPQKPSKEALNGIDRFESYAERVVEMYRLLVQRVEPLRFKLTDEQWDLHETVLRPLLHKAAQEGRGHMADVYKRAGAVAFRIAMVLTVLRAFEEDVPLVMADELEAEDTDVQNGLELARTYADHAVRFAEERLDEVEPVDGSSHRIAVMLRGVETRFSSGDAYEIARQEGITAHRRTLRRDLKKAHRKGLIRSLSDNGAWEKVDVDPLSDTSDVSDTAKIG